MQIQLQMKGRTLVAKLTGDLDHHSAKTVKDMLESAIVNQSAQNLVFDFSGLSFMDSSGIGVILGRYKFIHSMGGQVTIASKNKTVNRLIAMSGIERLISVYDSVELAVNSVQGGK